MKIITLTVTVLLLASLILIGVTASPYDPWVDLDDDGDIDIFDVVEMTQRYGTEGTPINKTELLLDLLDRVEALESGLQAPLYDSGWLNITHGEDLYLEHGLGTDEVLVYLVGKDDMLGTIHNKAYGGWFPRDWGFLGAYWWGLNDTHIVVKRWDDDHSVYMDIQWDEIRVQIWKIL